MAKKKVVKAAVTFEPEVNVAEEKPLRPVNISNCEFNAVKFDPSVLKTIDKVAEGLLLLARCFGQNPVKVQTLLDCGKLDAIVRDTKMTQGTLPSNPEISWQVWKSA